MALSDVYWRENAGMDAAGYGDAQLAHPAFLRTVRVRRASMRTDPLCSICPVSHKTLLQRLQRTARYTSFRVRSLHFLHRYGSDGLIRPARSRLYMEGAVSFRAVPSHSSELQTNEPRRGGSMCCRPIRSSRGTCRTYVRQLHPRRISKPCFAASLRASARSASLAFTLAPSISAGT
jgi:hypothetical protein